MPINMLILKFRLPKKPPHLHWIDMARLDILHNAFISHNASLSNSCHWKSQLNIVLYFKGFNEKARVQFFKIRLVSITIKYKKNKVSEENQ